MHVLNQRTETRLADFKLHDSKHTCASWIVLAEASLLHLKQLAGGNSRNGK